MVILKIAVTLLLCHKAATSHDILLAKAVEDSCLSKILDEITKDDQFLAISWLHRVDGSLLDEILELFKDKMILNGDAKPQPANRINRTPGTVILQASTKVDIVEGISSLRSANAWSVMTKFIILHPDGSGDGRLQLIEPFVKDVFHTFASLNARNVYFIYEIRNDFTPTLTLFSYKENTCGEIEPVVGASECGVHKIIRAKGVEINLVKELARWAHLDVESKAVDYPELKDKSFDTIISASIQMKDRLPQTIDFDFDELTWCVKKADLYPTWLTLFLIATWEVWTVATIGVYVTAATLYVFYHYYHHPQNFHYCTGMAAFCIFSITVPYHPTHGIARMHFGMLLIYGLLAVILINSFLISVLTKPKYQYQIQTTDELMYYHYKILIDEEVLSLHHLGDDEIFSYAKQNYESCNGMIACLSQLLERPNMAAIVLRKFAEHFESKINSSIFCFSSSEAFKKATRALTLSRSNYLLNKTNSFIQQAMETGHLLKWESVSAGRKNDEQNWNGPLTVEHFTGVLMAYALVVTLAVLAFIGEWFTFKNIQRGDTAGGFWKFLDKYILSPERFIWKGSSSAQNEVYVNDA